MEDLKRDAIVKRISAVMVSGERDMVLNVGRDTLYVDILRIGCCEYTGILIRLSFDKSKYIDLLNIPNNRTKEYDVGIFDSILTEIFKRFFNNYEAIQTKLKTLTENDSIDGVTNRDFLYLRNEVISVGDRSYMYSEWLPKVTVKNVCMVKLLNRDEVKPTYLNKSAFPIPDFGRYIVVACYHGYDNVESLKVGSVVGVKKRTKVVEYVVYENRVVKGTRIAILLINKDVNKYQPLHECFKDKEVMYVISNELVDSSFDALYSCNRVGVRCKRLNVVK